MMVISYGEGKMLFGNIRVPLVIPLDSLFSQLTRIIEFLALSLTDGEALTLYIEKIPRYLHRELNFSV